MPALEKFKEKTNKLTYIEPFANCRACGRCISSVLQIEPLEGRNALEVDRLCIVQCGHCQAKYISKYG